MKFGRKGVYVFSLLLLITSACMPQQEQFNIVVDQLLSGSVPTIQPEEVNDASDSVIILDTRSAAEYSVSHIAGAQFVNYDELDEAQLNSLDKNRPVLVYCTVGYRSEKVGEQLQKLGFKKVYNLYGGLIQWKNAGRQVVNADGIPTDSIHGYSPAWGRWILNGVPVYE